MPELQTLLTEPPKVDVTTGQRHKDEILNDVAKRDNVAQFISFGPNLEQRYSRIIGLHPNALFHSPSHALTALFNHSPESTINLRSFRSKDSKSSKFIYGVTSVGEAESALMALAAKGLYTIANETIDENDGGVSGVLFGNIIEFAPLDTPRCVERGGLVSAEREIAIQLLHKVYGFEPDLTFDPSLRVEFSLHPLRRGYLHKHTVIWEIENVGPVRLKARMRWPNSFSRFLGDKTFGLLVADILDLPVPATTVFPRWLPPFTFGMSTGTREVWLRTAPAEQAPGKFSTFFGWRDPFRLMNEEDQGHCRVSAVLSQEAVEAEYSGAVIADTKGSPVIEGVPGRGAEFMLGNLKPKPLPRHVVSSVTEAYERAYQSLRAVRFEWVHDGISTWIVQLHMGKTSSHHRTIYPGKPRYWRKFPAGDGIDNLRLLIPGLRADEGVIIVGEVGITSHLGDLLRKAKIPSWIKVDSNDHSS